MDVHSHRDGKKNVFNAHQLQNCVFSSIYIVQKETMHLQM